ncbi:MAG: hypothetical protein C4523_18900 [Myxococcales bacterium]|nr:MAG: hypothetical protein C4523_18900 [Myxococcales bacterium]
MSRELILANLHLYAVLPRLQELVKLDPDARKLAGEMKSAIRFAVRGGPSVLLKFSGGAVSVTRDRREGCDIGLYFTSPQKLNKMFLGQSVVPIPYLGSPGGLTRLGDLKRFTKLTEIMTRYLKPSAHDMNDPEFRARHVEMGLMVGIAGAGVIGESDPMMARTVKKLRDGTLLVNVKPVGPKAHVVVKGGRITALNGPIDTPSGTIEIKDLDTAVALLANKLDTFAAVGACDLRIFGLIPLADEFSALMDRVGLYLNA